MHTLSPINHYLELFTCFQQLLEDLFIDDQLNVIVLLPTGRQVAVNRVVPGLVNPELVVFQRLKEKRLILTTFRFTASE